MHMSDALISVTVGGTMLAASSSIAAYSVKKIQDDMDDKKIPLMGVMGAFIFAAQMINFTIPVTGSSGHIGGGMLLAILLGPYAGFLTMASILLIQALVFGDGGLLAYGCNLINLGFFTCFIAYPFIYKRFTGKGISSNRIFWASLASVIVGLQLGSFSVVIQTLLSGKTELPFGTFVLLMQPIHLAIGAAEGLITAAVVTFVWKARPEILERTSAGKGVGNISIRGLLTGLLIAAIITGGVLSWFASSHPDGLEWSLERAAVTAVPETAGEIDEAISQIQSKTAFLPDYNLKNIPEKNDNITQSVNAGTSVAGLVGSALTLGLAALIGLAVGRVKRKKRKRMV